MDLHHGNRLRWWIEKTKISVEGFLEKAGLKTYSNLYYYYAQSEIKRKKLEIFCAALGITMEQFLDPKNELQEDAALYTVSKHQGQNLETTIKQRGITVTSFADKMKVARPTVYSYFDEKELPLGVLLEAAEHLKVPVAMLKGVGVGEKSFEKDIYLQLVAINDKLQVLLDRSSTNVS